MTLRASNLESRDTLDTLLSWANERVNVNVDCNARVGDYPSPEYYQV